MALEVRQQQVLVVAVALLVMEAFQTTEVWPLLMEVQEEKQLPMVAKAALVVVEVPTAGTIAEAVVVVATAVAVEPEVQLQRFWKAVVEVPSTQV